MTTNCGILKVTSVSVSTNFAGSLKATLEMLKYGGRCSLDGFLTGVPALVRTYIVWQDSNTKGSKTDD
eukprot:6196232-Pleurochrysis_carterae.AAC.1